jgi:hypothetical protein
MNDTNRIDKMRNGIRFKWVGMIKLTDNGHVANEAIAKAKGIA